MTEPSAPDRTHISSWIQCQLHDAGTVNLDQEIRAGVGGLRAELHGTGAGGVIDQSLGASLAPSLLYPKHRGHEMP